MGFFLLLFILVMSKYYKEEDGLDWYIKAEKQQDHKYKFKSRNSYVAKTLKYCESCKRTFETNPTGDQVFYTHMPTYGLPRKFCKKCNN